MKKLMLIVFVFVVSSFSLSSFAGVTSCPDSGTHYITLGDISVDSSLPVGGVITTRTFGGADGPVTTTFGTWYIYYKYLTGSPGSFHEIKTNLQGIGIRMSLAEHPADYFPFNAKGTCRGLVSCWGDIPEDMVELKFELIKTAETVESGSLSVGEFGYGQCDNGGMLMKYSIGSGAINASTCSLDSDNIDVHLGSYLVSDFPSIGTTTTKKVVSIPVTCTDAGSTFTFKVSSADKADSSNGVIALDAGGATGIGVQLLEGDGATPVPLTGTEWNAGTSVAGENTINLYARYYQLDNVVTSGSANATATLLFNYK